MIVLGIETATRIGSVGLVRASERGHEVLASDVRDSGRTHGAMLLEQIDAALLAAGIELPNVDAVAVSIGPGSFTGLRVGIATAKALAWSSSAPIVGVPTLEAYARTALHQPGLPPASLVYVALDARKGEVYHAAFVREGEANGASLRRVLPDAVEKPENCAAAFRAIPGADAALLLGDGVFRYPEAFSGVTTTGRRDLLEMPPSGVEVARHSLARLRRGESDDVSTLVPVYVRASEAELSLASPKT